jgi:mono/diheme cytochrome c family protein
MKHFRHTFLALAALPFAATAAEVDFAREIRPLLSDNCFACHGPDSNKRKAGLRFDQKESAFGKAESGEIAIIPGDVEHSELLRRVASADGDEVMPPPKEHKKLKAEQVALLKRWIQEGATWTGHWAFQPVKEPAVPVIANPPTAGGLSNWAANPIDAFVLKKLGESELKPSPEEEPARLIRRLSLDLTGLPPTIAEVDAFVAACSSSDLSTLNFQLSTLVDRLLASPHFGERLALPWLDIARYGDTSGYHNDSLRDMWLWREWVIKAFNANMPFDEFTIGQLAGDLLPNATIDQQVASGFHRNVMTSDEGGLIEQEYLNLYVVDRVATTGTTWLGLTVACAQCHDHKYDPITQRDYYQIYAFFHNVPESGKDGVRDRNPKPFLMVPRSPEEKAEWEKTNADIASGEKEVRELEAQLDAQQIEWEKEVAASGQAKEPAGPFTVFPLDADANGHDEQGKVIDAKLNGEATFVEGAVGNSFRVEAKGHIDAGNILSFDKDQAFTAGAWLRLKPQGGAPFGKMEDAPNFRGWDLEIQGGRPVVHLIHQWPENAIHVSAKDALPFDTFQHVAFSYDGSGRATGVKIFVNGREVKTKVEKDKLTGTIVTEAPFRIAMRGGVNYTGRVDDLRIYPRALIAPELAQLGGGANLALVAIAPEQRTPEQKNTLRKYYRETQATPYLEAQKRLAEVRKKKTDLEKAIPNTMVMAELEKPRDTFIKVRGQYDQNGEKVSAAAPGFLPPIPPNADGNPLNRLDFARWLVSKDQPLTARVTINRWWAMLFGTGLVKTVNDFGAQGEWPSHPELLDWLAADFMKDWNVKRALKQIVMSATYRQSARVSPELLARDSENRLLARGPRQRLDAEMIRDNALAVAGILNEELGGKSIKPAQPAGTWEINEMGGQNYVKSTGADQYRRGLYVYWRRSTVYPSFITLDAPTREFCVAQRAHTSTPLQSLVLMNDPVFVEAARAFAQRIVKEGGCDNAARLRFAWRTALGRAPSEKEAAILAQTLDQQLATYAQDKAAATALLKVGDLPKPANADDSELAAWTAVSNVLLNLNETITN